MKFFVIVLFVDNLISIKKVIGYKGEIIWANNVPAGMPKKVLDPSKINKLGWKAKIDLESGLAKTYNGFLENYV
jgi:GDP-L-fucose synthase